MTQMLNPLKRKDFQIDPLPTLGLQSHFIAQL
jgi:hypothetical protein